MAKSNRTFSEQHLGQGQRLKAEPLINGRQDVRRIGSKELQWFQQALGHRDEFPVNIWLLGDSMTENYGATDDYHTWPDLFRSAIQNRYRNGGAGYKPSKHAQGITWPYLSNPDGKNSFTLAGAQTDDVDYGFGFGNLNTWLTNTSSKSITIDCDRFWVLYTEQASGVLTIDVDLGTPFALTTTKSTTPTTNAPGLIGRIFDSQTAWGTLPLGTHTVKVTATTLGGFLDGIMIFYTDGNTGIHVWNGGHSGYTSFQFDGTTGLRAGWADLAYQPYTPTAVADGVGNGTTTFTSASAAFVDNDIGSYIHFAAGASCLNGCARIIARASGTSVTLDRVITSASGIAFIMNRAQFTDGVIWGNKVITDAVTNSTTTLTSASQGAFTPNIVGASIAGTNIPLGTTITAYVSATQVTMSLPATTSATITATFGGSKILTSATAAFNPWDVGCYLTGPTGMPTGTYIARYDSATQVLMSVPATAAQSAQTVRFMGRQKYWCAPDLMTIEFGINDMHVGAIASFKPAIRNIVSLATERVGLGFPVGFPQRYTPSVVLLGMWAPAGTGVNGFSGVIGTTSGQKPITSETFDFDPADVGKTITSSGNTPIGAGNTIASVQDNRNATLTNNAVATTTAGIGTILNRTDLEKNWMPYRTAMFELASENTWRFFDLYSLGGYISTNDPLNLTYDLTHPNNHGAKWIADELDILITGQPRSGPIPVGTVDAIGDSIIGLGPDSVGKLTAGINGQALTAASGESSYGVSHGLVYAGPLMKTRVAYSVANVGAATFTDVGFSGTIVNTLTGGGTAATNDQVSGCFVKMPTLTVNGNAMGRKSANFTTYDIRWMPEFSHELFTDTAITNVRHWYGFFSGAPEASASPAVSLAAFRYDTGAGDTVGKWSTCTKDGTTLTTKVGVATIAVSTRYELRIEVVGTKGSTPIKIRFWINDVLVSEHTAAASEHLPANGKTLGWQTSVTTLTTAAAATNFGRLAVSH